MPNLSAPVWADEYLRSSGRHRASSQRVYRAIWSAFCTHLRKAGLEPEWAQEADVRAFVMAQRSQRTAARYCAFIFEVYDHAVTAGRIMLNPCERLKTELTEPERDPPLVLDDRSQGRFLAALATPDSWKRARDAALATLILGCGLKAGEALALKTSALQLHGKAEGLVTLTARNRPMRTIPVPEFAASRLAAWQAMRKSCAIRCELLFPARVDGGRLAASTVYRMIDRTLKRAGLASAHRGPELLRATFGARELNAGQPLALVQNFLGHRQPGSTARLLRARVSPKVKSSEV